MSDERQIRYCYLEQWKTLGGLSLQHPGFQYQIVADLRHVDARSLSLRCWKVPASGILTLCAEYVRRAVLLLEWAEATVQELWPEGRRQHILHTMAYRNSSVQQTQVSQLLGIRRIEFAVTLAIKSVLNF